jgi:Asp-tRNA(Asn)/Glu-tRNA(Gln) amidotransferase A subunit family amidase
VPVEPADLGLCEASRLIRARKLSPVELVSSCLRRARALDGKLLAWALLDDDGALNAARRFEAELGRGEWRGPLHGIPVGIKDIFDTARLRTEAGSRALAGRIPLRDSAAVEMLRSAGAVVLGKTHTTEFAYLDPAPTLNPWNPHRTPGGSSSGSAVAVAARMCTAALGTQTAGSTLRPAAFNGVVGFKPEFGRISTHGVIPLSWTMDHVGILVRSVEDAGAVYRALAGIDTRDPRTLNAQTPAPEFSSDERRPPRLGLAKEYFFARADEEMRHHTEEVAERLLKAGAEVAETSLPAGFESIAEAHRTIMAVEAAAYHEQAYARSRSLYRPKMSQLIEEGLVIPATVYARALERRREARLEFLELFRQLDAVLTPGAVGAAPEGLGATGSPVMQTPASAFGIPAVGLPTGLSRDGLPLGVQLIGAAFAERELLAVARWCERIVGIEMNPLDLTRPA